PRQRAVHRGAAVGRDRLLLRLPRRPALRPRGDRQRLVLRPPHRRAQYGICALAGDALRGAAAGHGRGGEGLAPGPARRGVPLLVIAAVRLALPGWRGPRAREGSGGVPPQARAPSAARAAGLVTTRQSRPRPLLLWGLVRRLLVGLLLLLAGGL